MEQDFNALSPFEICKRAQMSWDSKTTFEKERSKRKYEHIFHKLQLEEHDWGSPFEKLSASQKSIIIKGELIRTYDALDNKVKTWIKDKFNLSTFASKWYKLKSQDKKTLLNSITRQNIGTSD